MSLVNTHLTFKTHPTQLVVTVSICHSKGHGGVLDLAEGNDTRSSAAWLKAHVFHLICSEVSHQSPSCSPCVTTFSAACCSPSLLSPLPLAVQDHRRTSRLFPRPCSHAVCPFTLTHRLCAESRVPPSVHTFTGSQSSVCTRLLELCFSQVLAFTAP